MPRQKKKILLVDDEPGFTRLLKLNLEKAGPYEVRVENSGSKAAAAVQEFKPDLVFLDILMPDMDGATAAAQIRNREETRGTRIVFLTAVMTKEESTRMMRGAIGNIPCVAKPVTTEEIVAVIERELA